MAQRPSRFGRLAGGVKPGRASRRASSCWRSLAVEPLEPRVFLDAAPGSISGTVFEDLDRDGVFDPGEPGLRGLRIEIQRLGDHIRTFAPCSSDGNSVAIQGDRCLIGATGSAHLFDLATGRMLQTFRSPHPELRAYFGSSVAFVGNHVLVASPMEGFLDDGESEYQPFAYLFESTTGELLQTFLDPCPATWFANVSDVSIAGGDNRVLIGDRADGAAYLFDATTGELLRTFKGGFGRSVAFLGDDVLLAAKGAVYLFDAITGEQLRTFAGPLSGRFGGSLAAADNKILVGANDGYHSDLEAIAYLFDATTGELLHTFVNPYPDLDVEFGQSVAFLGDNVLIGGAAYGCKPGMVCLFDAGTGELLDTFRNPPTRSADPVGFGSCMAADGDHFLVGTSFRIGGGQHVHLFSTSAPTDNRTTITTTTITITDAQGNYHFADLELGNYVVRQIAARGYEQTMPDGDRTYRVIVGAGNDLSGIDFGNFDLSRRAPRDGSISGTVFGDLDGDGAFDPGEPGLVSLRIEIQRLGGHVRTFAPRSSDGNSVAIQGDRCLIGAMDYSASRSTAHLFDLATGKMLQTFRSPDPQLRACFGSSVAFVGNQALVASPLEGFLDDDVEYHHQPFAYLFDSTTGELLQSFLDPCPATWFANVVDISIAGANNRVLIGDRADGAAYLFDATAGELLRTFKGGGRSVAFFGDNVLVAGKGAVYLFDATTGEQLGSFANPAASGSFGESLAAADGKILVGASDRRYWNPEPIAYLFDAATGELLQTFINPYPSLDIALGESVAFVGDKVLIGGSGRGGTLGMVCLFDAGTGELLNTFRSPSTQCMDPEGFGSCLAAEGDHFLSASDLRVGWGRDVHLFSTSEGTVTRSTTTTTDAEGNFRLDGVTPGRYAVRAIVPKGYTPTVLDGDGTYTVVIVDGDNLSAIDFGMANSGPLPEPGPDLPPAPSPVPEPYPVPEPSLPPEPGVPPQLRPPVIMPRPMPEPDPVPEPDLPPEPSPVPEPSLPPKPGVPPQLRPPVIVPVPVPVLPPTPDNPAAFEFSGTVVYVGLEGGFYGILGEDGGHYDPLNLPSQFAEAGAQVWVVARPRHDILSIHMWGTILEIIDIQPDNSNAPEEVPGLVDPTDPLLQLDLPLVRYYAAWGQLSGGFTLAPSVAQAVPETVLYQAEDIPTDRSLASRSPTYARPDAVSTAALPAEAESDRVLRFDAALRDWEPEATLPLDVAFEGGLSDLLLEIDSAESALWLL